MNLTGVHLDNLNIAFHKAVEAQDYAKILFLFDAGANVNSKVHGGKSMPMSFMNRGPMLDGRFAPRWCNSMEYGTEYVWSPDDPWEEDTRTQEDFRQGVAISGGGLAQDKRMGITALMRAAAVIVVRAAAEEHLCTEGMEPQAGRPLPAFFCPITGSAEDEEGRRHFSLGHSRDSAGNVLEEGRRHPRHWVIRLLLMLGADPKIPGGWTCFGESILEFLSMHPSRLSGNSKCMFYVSSY
jgi:hypothetical protein